MKRTPSRARFCAWLGTLKWGAQWSAKKAFHPFRPTNHPQSATQTCARCVCYEINMNRKVAPTKLDLCKTQPARLKRGVQHNSTTAKLRITSVSIVTVIDQSHQLEHTQTCAGKKITQFANSTHGFSPEIVSTTGALWASEKRTISKTPIISLPLWNPSRTSQKKKINDVHVIFWRASK